MKRKINSSHRHTKIQKIMTVAVTIQQWVVRVQVIDLALITK